MITTSGRAPSRRCPVCGAPGQTCGTAHVLHVLDVPTAAPTQNREANMTLDHYDVRTGPGGYLTTLRLTPEGAKRRGLTDADKTSVRAALNAARTSESTGAGDDPQRPPLSTETTDLSAYKVDEVKAYLAGADETERARVLELEAARGDKARSTITSWTPST